MPKEEPQMCHFETVLSRISAADSKELTEIVQSTIKRYAVLFPEMEILYLALPKDEPDERNKILHSIMALEE